MKGWRDVGLMAFFVTSLTATTLFASPVGQPTDRSWLRQTARSAVATPAPRQLSPGKWLAAALLVGLSGYAIWKRKKLRKSGIVPELSQIQIGAVTKISPKAQLVVATIKGRSVLLGVTESNVTRLMWLDDAEDEQDDDEGSDRYSREPLATDRRSPGAGRPYANQLGVRRASSAAPRAATSSHLAQPRAKRQPSRFREILADAIGLSPRPAAASPVDQLADATEDRYVGRDTQRMTTRRGHETLSTGTLINVEGQAAGLVARLNRPET